MALVQATLAGKIYIECLAPIRGLFIIKIKLSTPLIIMSIQATQSLAIATRY